MANDYNFLINSFYAFWCIAAIGQTNIKRLVAYSSIGHIGYTLAGLATGSNEGIPKFYNLHINLCDHELSFIFLFANAEKE
jgi:NADH:ubiquinone oxidoreductase subunit 2 (subunit N)